MEAELYVASNGIGPQYGLYTAGRADGGWHTELLASADELSALALHPTLSVVYGTAGARQRPGRIHAWRLEAGPARAVDSAARTAVTGLADLSSGGEEPCHLAVDPTGTVLAATNYASGSIALWRLRADGSPYEPARVIRLVGSGPDPERQEAAHPHQVRFDGSRLYVTDLGADLLRIFAARGVGRDLGDWLPTGDVPLPPGTGPRHLVMLPGRQIAISGELASTVAIGSTEAIERAIGGDDSANQWQVLATSSHTGDPRNYPGDIERSVDGRHVYIANRGAHTVATVAIGSSEGNGLGGPVSDSPRAEFAAECATSIAWPQHLAVVGSDLLVAGRDSNAVVALPLDGGVPGAPRRLFGCPRPVWMTAASQ